MPPHRRRVLVTCRLIGGEFSSFADRSEAGGAVIPAPPVGAVRVRLLVRRDEGDGVAHGGEVLDLAVGDLHAPLVLGGHDDLDHGQRIDVQIVDEGLVGLDVLDGNTGDLIDDDGEAVEDLLAYATSFRFRWCYLVGVGSVASGISGQHTTARSGQRHDLSGVDQARAEADDQSGAAVGNLPGVQHGLHRQRDGRC